MGLFRGIAVSWLVGWAYMRMFRNLAFVMLLTSLFPARADAEINRAESIEWTTADADLVIRGSVASINATPLPPGWFDVTFNVSETIKGKASKQVTVRLRHVGGEQPDEWQAKKRDLLLFAVKASKRADDKNYNKATWALRSGLGDAAVLVLDEKQVTRAFARDFSVLETRDAILAAVRKAAPSQATKAQQLDAPAESPAFKALWAGSAVWLYVPVDAALETQAIAWLKSNDLRLREEAVAALANFHTVANVARMTTLLRDPAVVTVQSHDKPAVLRYVLRAQADKILTDWGVAHATPIIEQPRQP
ncbi:MAG TPA: hypothetical protein PLF40_00775 [Kofleriaceae bacterium]|nr:hypothetical protein [Kofleriaceae bacterium]